MLLVTLFTNLNFVLEEEDNTHVVNAIGRRSSQIRFHGLGLIAEIHKNDKIWYM